MKRRDEPEEVPELVYGVHPVAELLEARAAEIERVFALTDKRAGVGSLLRKARLAGVPVTHLPRDVLQRKLGARAVHQGIAAQVAPVAYRSVDEICDAAAGKQDAMLVVLDGVADPRNLGAALRTCAGAGVSGVILGTEGTAGLTAGAVKASAGTVERVAVGREPKIGRRLRDLSERGFRTLGLSAQGALPWDRADLTGRIVLVAGGEHRGLRPGTADACQELISVPLAGGVESLNVAVALGVLLFEALRQRRHPGP